ncbi:MAG: RNA-binding S4 domain-containing protein [Burkholderiales bacterium]|jgi:ribosome-associated protein|nr:RNA-binding S4 domain-containing protein [Nitrosomonadaceae bacterium]
MKQISYAIDTEYIELNHLLKLTGFADSGGAGGALVSSGVVKVDGQVELRKRNKIRAGQSVEIAGTRISVVATQSNAKAD